MGIIDLKNVSVDFLQKKKLVKAVDDVSFSLDKGEVLGIVGESGSGKSVTALSILGLLPYPKAYHLSQSSITFNGLELLNAQENLLRGIRGSKIGFIFQEPMSSLNPLHRIEDQIAENLMQHQQISKREARKKVLKLLLLTGIQNARKRMKAYPYELSGGQRQRASAIRAIIKHPSILFADEPTGALDSSSATELLTALLNANQELHTTILMVTHDAYAASFANRILIFRDGCILKELSKGDSGRHEFYETIAAEIAKSDTTRTGGSQK